MPTRNWELEVHENLAEEARREASILHNPRLARLYIERGVAVALLVVLTFYLGGMNGLAPEPRRFFFTCSIFGTMIAAALVSSGLFGLAWQQRRPHLPAPRADEPPPIGW